MIFLGIGEIWNPKCGSAYFGSPKIDSNEFIVENMRTKAIIGGCMQVELRVFMSCVQFETLKEWNSFFIF